MPYFYSLAKINEQIKKLRVGVKNKWLRCQNYFVDLAHKKISPLFLAGGILGIIILSFCVGVAMTQGFLGENSFASRYLPVFFIKEKQNTLSAPIENPFSSLRESPVSQEQAVVSAVQKALPAVVSIIITKDVPVYEQYMERQSFGDFFGMPFFEIQIPRTRQKGTQKQIVGSGTGFLVSDDGMILTNKHVVNDKQAEYTIITYEGKKYNAKVLARDPLQDLAILMVQNNSAEKFPVLRFGDSDKIQIGQSVIAIGNALGEFSNSVSVGVISGKGRRITASGGGISETLEDILQTDAAINKGNSGGPLLNLQGEVIGINVAMSEGAQNIAFAIPINKAKRDVYQVKTQGRIVYPFLGIRYVLITPEIQQANQLSVDYGILVVGDPKAQEPAVVPGSAADKAGIREGDIILEIDGMKITAQRPLSKILQERYMPQDKVLLKLLRDKKEINTEVILGEKAGE